MVNEANLRAADPRNYQLPGRVSLWFRKSGSILDADWKEFGNIIEPAFSAELERLEHFSQRRGLRAKDREVISSRSANLKFSIDEINLHNLQFAFGSSGDPTEGELVQVNDTKIKTNPGGGGVIDISELDIVPGSMVIRSPQLEGEVTFADYTVDDAAGTVTITALGDADDTTLYPELHLFYRKEVEAQKFEIFDGVSIEGEAKFQMLTPSGLQAVAVFNKVQISNDGDITIGDGTTWERIPLSMDILVDDDGELGSMYIINADELDEEA